MAQFRQSLLEGNRGACRARQGKGRATNNKHSTDCAIRLFPSWRMRVLRNPPKLAGHTTLLYGIYTHHEIETLRGAIAKLPP
jgi:hypothetical protein